MTPDDLPQLPGTPWMASCCLGLKWGESKRWVVFACAFEFLARAKREREKRGGVFVLGSTMQLLYLYVFVDRFVGKLY